MSNWPMTAPSRSERIARTAIVSGAANTKGTVTSLGAPTTTSFDWSGFYLIADGSTALAGRSRLDIYANNGSDVLIVEDLFVDYQNAQGQQWGLWLPIRVKSGAQLKAAFQDSTTTLTVNLTVIGMAFDFPGLPSYSRAVSCTDFAASTQTPTVTNSTAWTEVRSSTPVRIAALLASINAGTDLTRTAAVNGVDIGIGAAASEQVLFDGIPWRTTAAGFAPAALTQFLPCDIPAGSRLAFRTPSSVADTVGVALLGLAA